MAVRSGRGEPLKLLLDEMLSPAIARTLRARGYDVQAIKERPDLQGLADRDVVALARAEVRAIATCNLRDFRVIHSEFIIPGGPGHAGFVFVPTTYHLSRAQVGRLARAFESKLKSFPGDNDLANRETWI